MKQNQLRKEIIQQSKHRAIIMVWHRLNALLPHNFLQKSTHLYQFCQCHLSGKYKKALMQRIMSLCSRNAVQHSFFNRAIEDRMQQFKNRQTRGKAWNLVMFSNSTWIELEKRRVKMTCKLPTRSCRDKHKF